LTYKKTLHRVELDLPDILSLDPEKKLVTVEPEVTIGQLNDYLIERGWMLPVVPELDDLTIGNYLHMTNNYSSMRAIVLDL
jgi:delta24-sterol reductase